MTKKVVLEEGKDYLSEESFNSLSKEGTEADNNVVNMMAEQLNKKIKLRHLQEKFYVIGEDLFSALHNHRDMYKAKEINEIKNEYIKVKDKPYIFIFDSNYTMNHTVLFVVDNVNKKIDFYDTLKSDQSPLKKSELQKDFDLLKSFYNVNYPMVDKSDKVTQQPDEKSCAYYCGFIVFVFIMRSEYEMYDDKIEFEPDDVEMVKKKVVREPILEDVHNVVLDKDGLNEIQSIKIPKNSKKPPFYIPGFNEGEKIAIPAVMVEVWDKMNKLNKLAKLQRW